MSKYKAIRTCVDGLWFDSKREANRYCELQMLVRSGIIHNLERQVPFVLSAWNPNKECAEPVGKYIADFTYQDLEGRTVVEDVKGMKTPLYNWKKRHFEMQYGLRIIET